jgi:CubicO group peptidase (beta-lactamase class C family)
MGTITVSRAMSAQRGSPAGNVVRAFGAGGLWISLLLATLLTTIAIGRVLLGVVLLGSGPSPEAGPLPAILGALLIVTAGLAWLTARFAASWRSVGRAVGLLVGGLALVGVTWALSAPDQALYLAGDIVRDGGNPQDYQEYPQRPILNGPTAYHFPQNPSPQLFQSIQYRQGGQLKQANLNDFLTATQTTSFVVIKNGVILDESYANGYSRDSLVTSESDAKSVVSALVGIAIHEGYIGSVNDLMVGYLPEMRGRGFDTVTIRDLLTMSAGINFTYDNELPLLFFLPLNDNARSTNYPNLRRFALGLRPSADPPGTVFSYNNGDALLLGMILERTTHRSVSQYLQEKIWQPLGMEYPASWSLDSTQSGFEKMAMGLNARAIDFAKFGQLYLDNGVWNGQQIIPAQWVRDSTTPDPADTRPWRGRAASWITANGYYGYLWWGQTRPDGSYVYMARGGHNVGQLQWIYVSPKDKVVIVQYGLVDGSVDWWPDVFQEITAAVAK